MLQFHGDVGHIFDFRIVGREPAVPRIVFLVKGGFQMANRESGEFRRGREREEESRRGSGRQEQHSQRSDTGGREGYSESERGEFRRGYEQGGTLYGQGRRSEEPWRPGQAGYSERESPYGGRGSQYGAGGYSGRSEYGQREFGGFSQGYGSSPFGREDFSGSPGFGYGSSGAPDYAGTRGATRGRFSGKGPKGYIRSDERINEDVCDLLEIHGEIDASDIVVRVEGGEVTLDGTVEDRWTKRMVEDLVDNRPGVKQVHNRLRLQQGEGQPAREQRQTQGRSQAASSRGSTSGKSLGSSSGSAEGSPQSGGSRGGGSRTRSRNRS
jgi:hypothetical protein